MGLQDKARKGKGIRGKSTVERVGRHKKQTSEKQQGGPGFTSNTVRRTGNGPVRRLAYHSGKSYQGESEKGKAPQKKRPRTRLWKKRGLNKKRGKEERCREKVNWPIGRGKSVLTGREGKENRQKSGGRGGEKNFWKQEWGDSPLSGKRSTGRVVLEFCHTISSME